MKTSVKIILGLVVLLLGAAIAVPFVFGDKIAAAVAKAIDDQIEGDVTWESAKLSIFANFPSASVVIEHPKLSGKAIGAVSIGGETDEVAPPLLFTADSVDVGVDLLKAVFEDTIVIENLEIRKPVLNLRVDAEGKENFDVIESKDDETSKPYVISLKRVVLRDGTVSYVTPTLDAQLEELSVDGDATLTDVVTKVDVRAAASRANFKDASMTYLRDAKVDLDAKAELNSKNDSLQLKAIGVGVNDLRIEGDGELVPLSKRPSHVRVALKTPSSQTFDNLMSAIPSAYVDEAKKYNASGTFSMALNVDGQLTDEEADVPAFSANVEIADGRVKYNALPKAVQDVFVKASLVHPGGPLTKTTLDLEPFSAKAGSSTVKGTLHASNLVGTPQLDLNVNANADLRDIKDAVAIDGLSNAEGKLKADIRYVGTTAKPKVLTGSVKASSVKLAMSTLPPTKLDEVNVEFESEKTTIQTLQGSVGKSDFAIGGTTSSVLSLLDENQTLRGNLSVRSKQIDLTEFAGTDAPDGEPSKTKSTSAFVFPSNTDLSLKANIDSLIYDDIVVKNVRGDAALRDQTLKLGDVQGEAIGGTMKLDGEIVAKDASTPKFDLSYDVKDASIQEAFNSVSSLSKFAPIGKFLSGNFSTSLKAAGNLGEDMMPNLRSIDASGLFATLNTKIADFPILSKIASAIPNVPDKLSDLKAKVNFNVEDGNVRIAEFPVTTKGKTFFVEGQHGLDNEMKYTVRFPVEAKSLLKTDLMGKLSKFGVPVESLTDVDVVANVTGSLTSPKIGFDIATPDVKQTLKDAALAQVDKARDVAADKLSEQAEKLLAEAQKQADALLATAQKTADRLRQEGDKRAGDIESAAGSNPLKARGHLAANAVLKRIEQRGRQGDERSKKQSECVDRARS
ncbi:MAG: AsmA-like C-terminal region-containing protein [Polyangiales bacterium]